MAAPASAQFRSDVAPSRAISHSRNVTVMTVGTAQGPATAGIDFGRARALALPRAPHRSGIEGREKLLDALTWHSVLGGGAAQGALGVVPGARGNGTTNPVRVAPPQPMGAPDTDDADDGTADALVRGDLRADAAGTAEHAFTTARADLTPFATNTGYPYRASGKLFFKIGVSTYTCSASLIKRGVVVTAAHCVAEFGRQRFYGGWQFIPAYRNGSGPYGVWTVRSAIVVTSYYDGTDPCAIQGIVCQNDVAVLLLNPIGNVYAGAYTGWYAYGWDAYGFAGGLGQISQIGYPVCLDSGVLMQRNDSYGYASVADAGNTVIGTLMCAGASGGPWLVNFGIRPTLTGAILGSGSDANVVVGVTSWGYVSGIPQEQGASPFTSANIVPLVTAACAIAPRACA